MSTMTNKDVCSKIKSAPNSCKVFRLLCGTGYRLLCGEILELFLLIILLLRQLRMVADYPFLGLQIYFPWRPLKKIILREVRGKSANN